MDRTRSSGAPVALGHALEEHIAGWIARVERTGHWTRRSDIHERLMAEVEKIVIRAALEKFAHVQTEAADFLGISRNTLAKKIRAYGIRPPRPGPRAVAGEARAGGKGGA